ncbi:AraC family transcriptional regulator [Telmatospirillum sp.]|uniref:AraC family transcriptional regulator n=1 Tax=Telmatospirillum sp. TaxID=2079197 RepID=UPI00283D5C85|nr:AraC family transcriptional regulator [Telmatospirillum sp.]MDR3435092.1 AraC family transcriptional regulator [Telmatospirillum sp.]
MPDPMNDLDELVLLAGNIAINEGYTATSLPGLRLLRSGTDLNDVPVLYRPGAVFVLQGAKRGFLGEKSFVYDARHYLAVSVPVSFRMESRASPEAPLLAVYMDFDLSIAAELIGLLPARQGRTRDTARSLVSSPMERGVSGTLLRLLMALADPVETAALGRQLVRELHYRVLTGAQGAELIAALRQAGGRGGIGRSLAYIRRHYRHQISIAALAAEAGMSVPTFHSRFRELIGTTPLSYIKSIRLHEARLLMARDASSVAAAAAAVGYVSTSQFSREFKRHFGRTASEEVLWMRAHLGELAQTDDHERNCMVIP